MVKGWCIARLLSHLLRNIPLKQFAGSFYRSLATDNYTGVDFSISAASATEGGVITFTVTTLQDNI